MKIEDVKIGGEYLTKIGESRQRVIVVRRVERQVDGRSRPPRFEVRRYGNEIPLPKFRSARALHRAPVKAGISGRQGGDLTEYGD